MTLADMIRANGMFIQFITPEKRSYDLCFAALLSNPHAIKYIPYQHIDDGMIEHLVAQGEEYLEYLPYDNLSEYSKALLRVKFPSTVSIMFAEVKLNQDSQKDLEWARRLLGMA